MFAGHFGLAAAVKAKQPEVPLWALMLSTQLLDVIFVPLVLTGVESIDPIGKGGYGEAIIHANYTHSLVGALLIAGCAGLISWRLWGRKGGLLIAGMVFSHWLLDLLVHRSDMPILPGNLGHLPLLGFGLWGSRPISIALEGILIVVGGILYFSSALARAREHSTKLPTNLKRALLAGSVMSLLLLLSLVTDVMGIG
ncbi:permease [Ktedonosporobacter rubrisoli]|uniref:Permease n=1 Tax=Ktedonosporobacter rubrisoli TaxID=2509675 RepID=A0A4P6JMH9_KTERU|nr:permease [Ktedonosporobacter rubrisoli]QBD76343.1 permease [Ktedonosporobacter rubrisoli]